MIKILGIIIAVLACVIVAFLAIGSCYLVAENKKLKKDNQKKEEEIKQNEHQHKINNEAKESFETGNSSADFDASINVLSNLKKKKKIVRPRNFRSLTTQKGI